MKKLRLKMKHFVLEEMRILFSSIASDSWEKNAKIEMC